MAIKERLFTYYQEGSEPVITGGPLQGGGRVWIEGEYIPPTYPNPLNMRVGEAGVKLWMLIGWLESMGNDPEAVLRRHGEMVSGDDIRAALWFYRQNEDEIRQKLVEEEWIA